MLLRTAKASFRNLGGPNILNQYEQVIRSKNQSSYALNAIRQKPPSYVRLTGPVGTAFWPTSEPLSAS